MGHKSGQCKSPGCNKEQWKDGYCRNCAQYAIQKATIDNLQSTTNLLLQVAEGLKRVEEKVQDLQPKIVENKVEKIVVKERQPSNQSKDSQVRMNDVIPKDSEDTFIPTINSSNVIPQIRDTKSSTIDKDLNRIANKLSKTKVGG